MLYNFSMMPIDDTHFDEVCRDLRDQVRRGISTCPLFIMSLVPEGDPVWDKVGPMVEKFIRYRDALKPDGIPLGVLIQSSLGHGYDITHAPFTRFVGVRDGEERNVYCPLDKAFLSHFKGVVRTIAEARPAAIMLDDDFRLVMRPGQGCACPLHLAELAKRTGREWTRDELWAHIDSHPDDDPVTVCFVDLQRDSLVEAARVFREGIDEVDPTIQGINCTSGDVCDSVVFTNPEFCGKGNPTMVRVPNGTYAPLSVREFSDIMRRAAVCSSKLRKNGIRYVLAETDTIPFNRYGKNARYLHSHYTASLLEGLVGAKHWITRTAAFEPKSGKAFRDILAEHRGFYERLSALAAEISWQGANSAFLELERHRYHLKNPWRFHENTWATKVFERMGLPFYFAEPAAGATFLEDNITKDMTDSQIEEIFRGSVFMTSEVAEELSSRGYGELIGVSVRPWEGATVSGEVFLHDESLTCTRQKNFRELLPASDRVEVLSYAYHRRRGLKDKLFPAVTVLDRGEGRLSVVFCGTPDADHNYMEGFAFLNETRKEQLVSLLRRAGALPVYYEGDEEVLLRAGRLSDGRMLVALFNLGYDPLEELDLVFEQTPTEIKLLDKDGTEVALDFVLGEGGKVKVMTELQPMYPLVLLIK